MTTEEGRTFQEALDIIESLPEYQQADIIEIVRKRLIEHSRELLASNIGEARREYARGDIRKGSVDDLMREISE